MGILKLRPGYHTNATFLNKLFFVWLSHLVISQIHCPIIFVCHVDCNTLLLANAAQFLLGEGEEMTTPPRPRGSKSRLLRLFMSQVRAQNDPQCYGPEGEALEKPPSAPW